MDEMEEINELLELYEALDEFDTSDDESEEKMRMERRQYKMQPRIDMSKWDDDDFLRRFRLRKGTVALVLEMIEPKLKYSRER